MVGRLAMGSGFWSGRTGVAAGVLVWGASLLVLWRAMGANEAAWLLLKVHGAGRANGLIAEQHAAAVGWALLFTALQIASMLVIAFTLRAAYRLRTAVCFTTGAAIPMVLNGAWLLAVLFWLRFAMGPE